ncbi:regulator of G-protein signaling 9-binding protein C-like [Rhinoraja longicauda]
MPIHNTRVADEAAAASARARDECKSLVESLAKLTSCYRHLAMGVGGSSDSAELRDELWRTGEKTQDVSVVVRDKLTAVLRDKRLGGDQRAEMERLWVAFSSCLELFQVDLSKVLNLCRGFPLAGRSPLLVRTGMSGAVSVQDNCSSTDPPPSALEQDEELREQIARVDRMVESMETKVNVLRWTVESKGDSPYLSALSNDSSSVALLSVDEEGRGRGRGRGWGRGWWCCGRGTMCLGSVLVCTVAAAAAAVLSV